MLERRSAVAAVDPYRSAVLRLGESRGFTLLQAAGLTDDFENKLSAVVGTLPARVGTAVEHDGRTLMRVGPRQIWIVGSETDGTAARIQDLCAVTPLSHSRTRIVIDGAPSREVLTKGIPLDFHPATFTPGMFALTGLHHTPVLVHCVGDTRFELYCMRTFAMSVWDWLTDAALEFAA